jgi:3-hydroxyacyl-CoA dehydrogenase/enoyl-CoA hydratase/3-hydroxybutyryl-CoA epimerase/3-hydroxyacyl-CoA dehydrogenase/enoyl-CoA hydratase/3-hydroxybutyryl-CoA epimerase/enoyl-CoA isomerase
MDRSPENRDSAQMGQAPEPSIARELISLPPIRRVGVLGAGQMGGGIAGTVLRAKIPTVLVDSSAAMLETGSKRALQIAARASTHGGSSTTATDRMADSLLCASAHVHVLSDCDVVIEAVTENEAIKTAIFRDLAGVLRKGAILASNTSTIPITRMARSWIAPERFAGMHFFHPAHRMELVEIIRGEQTSDPTVSTLVALAQRLGKTPIVVRDGPGFLTTRILFPYLGQALALLEEGNAAETIDSPAIDFGMPSGPIALLDFIGLDTALAISRVMAEGFPERASVSPLLAELVELGRLGQKTGAGFYRYEPKGSPGLPDPLFEEVLRPHRRAAHPSTPEAIIDRLFLPMLLESLRALDDGIASDPADVDKASVLGFGFPASRGGILAWGDTEGAPSILARVARYQSAGQWFCLPATLKRMARSGESFRAGASPSVRDTRP